jgi:4-amino-4-deoxy-L-arabinose transferase-like glycosyltransferase
LPNIWISTEKWVQAIAAAGSTGARRKIVWLRWEMARQVHSTRDLNRLQGDELARMMPVRVRQPLEPAAVAAPQPRRRWMQRLEVAAPFLLALYFFGSALYGVNRTEVIDTDAARHAMNGAFIYDLVRTGHLLHPIEYGKFYYNRMPALSIPFHPPLFPAIEAIFFAVFGVHLFTARLAIALCVAVSAFLLYRVALTTLGYPILAACITLSTFSLWTTKFVARDVMLEFPSLVFTLAAIYCLRGVRESYPMRRAVPFALLAAAALWTKQHTVFLGAVPFLEAALVRRWRRFLEWPIWVSSAVYGVAVLAIIWFSRLFHGTGINMISTSTRDVYYIVNSTLPHYFAWITTDLAGMPGVLTGCAIAVYLWSLRRRDPEKPLLGLYIVWVLAAVAILVDLGPIAPRYLFFVMPATMAMAFAWLFHGCRRLWGKRVAGVVSAVFAAGFVWAGLGIPFDFLRGPAAAARVVVEGKPTRVLYAGEADANFIFAIRELDPGRQIIVIPAVKLPPGVLKSADMTHVTNWYGVEWVVIENTPGPHPWSEFQNTVPPVSTLQRSIPLESSRMRWRTGSIDVYHVNAHAQNPGAVQFSVPGAGEPQ